MADAAAGRVAQDSSQLWPWEDDERSIQEIVSKLRLSSEESEHQRRVVHRVFQTLSGSDVLKQHLKFNIDNVIKGGSFKRGTDIAGNMEVDLVVLSRSFSAERYPQMLAVRPNISVPFM